MLLPPIVPPSVVIGRVCRYAAGHNYDTAFARVAYTRFYDYVAQYGHPLYNGELFCPEYLDFLANEYFREDAMRPCLDDVEFEQWLYELGY